VHCQPSSGPSEAPSGEWQTERYTISAASGRAEYRSPQSVNELADRDHHYRSYTRRLSRKRTDDAAGSAVVVVSATAGSPAIAYAVFNVSRLKLWKADHTRKNARRRHQFTTGLPWNGVCPQFSASPSLSYPGSIGVTDPYRLHRYVQPPPPQVDGLRGYHLGAAGKSEG
jgi:hypothetical protein